MKNRIDRILILPTSGTGFIEQFANCLEQMKPFTIGGDGQIIQQSFFINVSEKNVYLEYLSWIYSSLDTFYDSIPSTSVIAQSPANGMYITAELIILTHKQADTCVIYKIEEGIHYTVIETRYCKELYAGGITAKASVEPFSEQVKKAYTLLKSILDKELLIFSDIVRQWNYIEQILSIHDDNGECTQNYQVLNDVRSAFYSQVEFTYGYPAATGIGMNTGGFILEVYAVKSYKKVEIVPLRNPKQVDAYHYSNVVLVGDAIEKQQQKTTPKFERAKYISIGGMNTVYISGTASIQNEKTIGEDNIGLQTQITLDNIAALISAKNISNTGIRSGSKQFYYSFIRVYIKNPSDTEIVTGICKPYFGNIPIHYLIADVCREKLLLEIEGVAEDQLF
jgi:enamine deaminase RidA (YjgF/YER057c/UK114 family)